MSSAAAVLPAEPNGEAEALADFRRRYPAYDDTSLLDVLRATEYARLDAAGEIYLDYTGGGLYAESQLVRHMNLLRSVNPASLAATELVERARAAVLRFFNASPDEYAVIFTPNASGALKLVGEAYPFAPDGHLLLTYDNHTSVNGLRDHARAAGAPMSYLPSTRPRLRVDEYTLDACLRQPGEDKLFAYPAQSNFSGVQHPLEWIEWANDEGWDVLVDCAAFVPSNRLDLTRRQPDFVPISFYKLLGYPTGVGCLLVRHAALAKLRCPVNETVDYLALPAIEQGLGYVETVGMDTIHTRVTCLTGWLLDALGRLHHSNGSPVVEIYGPRTTEGRGGAIAFNFLRPDGAVVDERVVDRRAAEHRVSLCTGSLCNPGATELALGIGWESLVGIAPTEAPSAGAVRVSVGTATNFVDVYRFMGLALEFRDRTIRDVGLPPR